MSFIENEIFPALSHAVNYVLKTFDSPKDRDLEGLVMRILLLNKLEASGLYNVDLGYGKRISPTRKVEIRKWANSYLEKIDGDLKNLLRDYAQILDKKAKPRFNSHLEFDKKAIISDAKNTYVNLDYERIFANCNNCPVRFLCFCEFKTFLVCTFSGRIYLDEGSKLRAPLLQPGFIERRSLTVLVRQWLRDNLIDMSSPDICHTGFPYLIKGVVEEYVEEKGIDVSCYDHWKDRKYVEVDPYITTSLLSLLMDETFASEFDLPSELRLARESELYTRILETILRLQHRDDKDKITMKKFILDPGDFSFRKYPIYGSWDEGYWGGTKTIRVKSTADIARMLYELEGMSSKAKATLERAMEFVIRAFMRKQDDSDKKSGKYVIDQGTFRHIQTAIVSNTIGTIAALRFLVSVDEIRGKVSDNLSIPEDVKRELGDPEEFLIDRLRWLIEQQRGDGAFPILSEEFIDTYFRNVDPPTWVKDVIRDPETRKICNSSLNATIDAILLFIEYAKRQSEEPLAVLNLSPSEARSFRKLPVNRRSIIRDTLQKFDTSYSLILPGIDNKQEETLEDARKNLIQGLLHNNAVAFEATVRSISKVFEGFLLECLTKKAVKKWGADWRKQSKEQLGLREPVDRLSYGSMKQAFEAWNKRFPQEIILPHDFIRRMDFFRIVRILCTHEKKELGSELAAFRKAWKESSRFESDFIFAIDNALFMMAHLGELRPTPPTTGEYFKMTMEELGRINRNIEVLKNRGFPETRKDRATNRRSINEVTESIRLISKGFPRIFGKLVQEESQSIIELLLDIDKALSEADSIKKGVRKWLKSAKEDRVIAENALGILTFIWQTPLIPDIGKSDIPDRIRELLLRITNKFLSSLKPESRVEVRALPGRITTGSAGLDHLLYGGIPKNYAVMLTSPSCDEKDLLIERFLKAGAKEGQTMFYITTKTSGVKNLAEEFPSNLYLLICNPQADRIIKDKPNVSKLKGVENLTDINIALSSAFRKMDVPIKGPRRICVEIISDVLLQHHAVQTRKWLNALIPDLKSKGFTTLAVIDSEIHPQPEVRAIVGVFDGEINIYEKETEKGLQKFLKIKKMTNQEYSKSELSLQEEKLQE